MQRRIAALRNEIKAVIFDMDDTLYDEKKFVYGGFLSVAKKISEKYPVKCDVLYADMLDILSNQGRGKIFDGALRKNGIYSPALVEEMVSIYRNYVPSLEVYPDVFLTFDTLRKKNIILGIITDGLHSVQKNKVSALDLERHTDFVYYTDELGEGLSKPHPFAFEKVLKTFGLRGDEAIYIGNDPTKDFTGANAVGMSTCHISRQGFMYKCRCDASFHITSLTELVEIIHYMEHRDRNAQCEN
jgi:putative hydrolase of the HAD superfamily